MLETTETVMEIYTLELSQKDAAAAAGVTSRSVQNWCERDYIVGHKGGGVQGKNRKFTFNSVMQLAMTEALIVAGLSEVKKAAEAAVNFAHLGSSGEAFGLPARAIAFPFHFREGHTVFAVGPYGAAEAIWDAGIAHDTFGYLREKVGASMVIVDATEVFVGVINRLGLDLNDVMGSAYPEAAKA